MKIHLAYLNNMKRAFLALTIITILSSISSTPQGSRFSKTNFLPSKFEAENDNDFAEGRTRVKRQTFNWPCNLPPINCNNIPNLNKYRTIDGTCNNLFIDPYCGVSNLPFQRWAPRSPSGEAFRCPLPSCARPRDITSAMNRCPQDFCDSITVMLVQWGQFIDHDLVVTTEETDDQCCQDFKTKTPTSANCAPIDVEGDSFYSNLCTTVKCLPFSRSRKAPCTNGADRQTINELTSYLDASMVYGSTDAIASNLRTFSNGRLKTGPGSETLSCPGATPDVCPRSFLPVRTGASGNQEFFAGDGRVEEQPSLTSMHTLFIRLHNDIAKEVCSINSPDEQKYQAARKIVGAIVQQITFNEFLPVVLGQTVMNDNSYGQPLSLDKPYSYNQEICTIAPNVFSTAAFRFGHSLLPNAFQLSNGNAIQLRETFNNHGTTLNPNAFPSHFLGGIIFQSAMPMDQHLVEAVHNFLFAQGPPFRFGEDLYARNIQRGRDHGIPGYVHWYNKCKKPSQNSIASFSDLNGLMPNCVITAFKALYKDVKDIDLFPAGIAEYKVPDGVVGPTFACIIAEFFSDIKYGDRFWFQNTNIFTSSQIASIKKTRLSSLICLYTNVEEIQPFVMLPHTGSYTGSNPLISCLDILEEGGVIDDISEPFWGGSKIC